MPYSLKIEGGHEPEMMAMKLLPGEIAQVVDPLKCTGMIVMRIFGDVLSLNNPRVLLGDDCELMVRRLTKGTVVSLTVE